MYFYSKADPNGRLYCVKFDKVEASEVLPCLTCEYFRGSLQGEGRECEVGDDGKTITILDPYEYMDTKRAPEETGEGL